MLHPVLDHPDSIAPFKTPAIDRDMNHHLLLHSKAGPTVKSDKDPRSIHEPIIYQLIQILKVNKHRENNESQSMEAKCNGWSTGQQCATSPQTPIGPKIRHAQNDMSHSPDGS
jgi:hypothetical protein